MCRLFLSFHSSGTGCTNAMAAAATATSFSLPSDFGGTVTGCVNSDAYTGVCQGGNSSRADQAVLCSLPQVSGELALAIASGWFHKIRR